MRLMTMMAMVCGMAVLTLASPAQAQQGKPSCGNFCARKCAPAPNKNACMSQCMPKCSQAKAGQQ